MPAKPPGTCTLDQNIPVETAASFFINPLTGGEIIFQPNPNLLIMIPGTLSLQRSVCVMWPRRKAHLPSSTPSATASSAR